MACGLAAGVERETRAALLHADLLAGRWQLDRVTFDLHESDTAEWANAAVKRPSADEVALASAAEWVWAQPESRGQQALTLQDRLVTVIWRRDGDRLAALIAGPDYARGQWLAKLPGVRLNGAGTVHRTAAQTGLPWAIAVEPGAVRRPGSRQSLWIAGLLVIAALAAAGAYFIIRAAARELAVARLQSDFVAAVSHEFRTPLTSLRQVTEVLRDGRVASEDRRQTYYDALARQTERLHQLVESLLDFGRMEAGRSPYRLQPLDARAWVQSVVEQFSRESAARGYNVDLDLNGAAATIAADPSALTNALWNLLENAVKYSPDCKTVWVIAERDRDNLAVRVRDQGLGILREEQKEIFRKFVRGAGAKNLGIQGTGIGLAMVEHIVRAHGGEVRVESEPGSGSMFTILLPCHES